MIDAIRIGGADAVLAASIFHYADHSIMDIKREMAAAGLPIRLEQPQYAEEFAHGDTGRPA